MTYLTMNKVKENSKYAIELCTQQVTVTDIESQCQDMKLRVNTCYKDLLQVTRKASHKFRDVNSTNLLGSSRPESSIQPKPKCFPDDPPLELHDLDHSLQSDDLLPLAGPNLRSDASALENPDFEIAFNGELSLHPVFWYEVDFLH